MVSNDEHQQDSTLFESQCWSKDAAGLRDLISECPWNNDNYETLLVAKFGKVRNPRQLTNTIITRIRHINEADTSMREVQRSRGYHICSIHKFKRDSCAPSGKRRTPVLVPPVHFACCMKNC